ncbi:DotI/IcmL/TraM family protein [Legionella impletisoli]|uniref:Protein IcmL (DotI) n=1 Tax=Legionella impletisoli TaxID=343510 RepID=A0A917JVP7_9GAMM|nr:DotI/IcmL/TraM family protein [Legionella impletisoli]GGI83889.1 hypothetical protein GCM10007966_10600 [Legionella impletisoli]
MSRRTILSLFLVVPLLCSSLSYANDPGVSDWTQKTLLETLAIDYTDNEDLYQRMRPNYTYNAWNALGDFLQNYIQIVQANKLVLHPKAIGPATILESGVVSKSNFFAGIPYWRVHQLIRIPELNLTIDFTVLVIANAQGKYIIPTINMALQ